MHDEASTALDPIRALGARLWVTELAPSRGARRYQVDGWISDWRRRAGGPSTAIGFAFELEGSRVRAFRVLVHGRVRPFDGVTSVEEVVRRLQVAVKVAQGRIVVVEAEAVPSSI